MGQAAVTAYRELLGVVLRSCRERAGLSPTQTTKTLGWYSGVKIAKIEAGAVKLPESELADLLRIYRVEERDAARLRVFGELARQRPDARAHSPVSTFRAFVTESAEIRCYTESVVPNLAQTEDYAYSLLATSLSTPPSEVGRTARERVAAQEVLSSPGAPRLHLVTAEPALLRPVGGPLVHRAQLTHLRGLADLPNVTFQVIPLDRGEHSGLGVPFTLIRLAVPEFSTVHVENLTGATYADSPAEVDAHGLAFRRLTEAALDAERSLALLDRLIAA
ncbi:helix-turn-helix transcriptional regulator [Kutzneria viridogrisea]|uniref:DUF5753 domain-containing protein n=2 Tax=Kutzneria TaxID=43356 RepID=W5W649_9PSEU|nr:helix-turn-helix transcriptional regulator [Kutzneria albida]AHH93634.1 hypothetical protein KALB_257 [Kutzneria albida DSM 43870]MBA8928982.1 hypothetical protein [Kutzneria viridogrisea]